MLSLNLGVNFYGLKFSVSDAFLCLLVWGAVYNVLLHCLWWTKLVCRGVFISNVVFLGCFWVILNGTKGFTIPATGNTKDVSLMLVITLGCILYDYVSNELWPSVEWYHLVSTAMVILLMVNRSVAAEAIAGIIIFEFTEPSVTMIWLTQVLERDNSENKTLFKILDWTVIVMLFWSRVLFTGFVTYVVFSTSSIGLTGLCSMAYMVQLLVLSWYHLTVL